MKTFLKSIFFTSTALVSTAWVYPGINLSYSFVNVLLTGTVLTIVLKIIKPAFELVFLPINILTLGLLRWLRTVISLGLIVYLMKTVQVKEYFFPGFSFSSIYLKPILLKPIFSLLLAGFIFNLLLNLFRWLCRKS